MIWFKRLYRYLPSITFSLVEILIIVGVLENSNYSDKTIIAALVIIYATIRSVAMGVGLSIIKLTMALATDLTLIKERIRKDSDTDEEWEKLKIRNEEIEISSYKLIIRWIGIAIIYLIGLVNLLS